MIITLPLAPCRRWRWFSLSMKKNSLLLYLVLLTGCVFAAPVQEMSDARQAIRSAEEAGASQFSPEKLGTAQSLLQQAQRWLDQKAYGNARQYALDARDEAIVAREIALSKGMLRNNGPDLLPLQ